MPRSTPEILESAAAQKSPIRRLDAARPGVSQRKLARHEVGRVLRERILDGQCKGGAKLVQGKIAKDFGVSVGVVREALLELQAWGLVETQDNHGVTVTRWSVERLLESYDIRERLEGLAAGLCCGRVDESADADLRRLAQEIYDSAAGDWDTNARLDRDFHHRIVQLSGSRTLLRMVDTYRLANKMTWTGQPQGWSESLPKHADRTRRQHLEILDAIHRNHPEEAENAAREHVAMARRSIAELSERGKFLPHWLT